MLRLTTMCILRAEPPTGFTLTFPSSIVIINPPNASVITKRGAETDLPLYILTTSLDKVSRIINVVDEYYVVSPPPKKPKALPPAIYIYPPEKPIHIPKKITAYYINPPPQEEQEYFILLETPFARILIVPRTTYIQNPPTVDIILTNEKTLQQAKNKSKKIDNLPKYLGADAQWCITTSKIDKKEGQIVYINRRRYIIQRHLTQINIIEITD